MPARAEREGAEPAGSGVRELIGRVHQPHVPEATQHAGTAKVTRAITATRTKAVPRRVIQLLMVMRDSGFSEWIMS